MEVKDLTKKELGAIMDCVIITNGTLNGNVPMSPREAVRRLVKMETFDKTIIF